LLLGSFLWTKTRISHGAILAGNLGFIVELFETFDVVVVVVVLAAVIDDKTRLAGGSIILAGLAEGSNSQGFLVELHAFINDFDVGVAVIAVVDNRSGLAGRWDVVGLLAGLTLLSSLQRLLSVPDGIWDTGLLASEDLLPPCGLPFLILEPFRFRSFLGCGVAGSELTLP